MNEDQFTNQSFSIPVGHGHDIWVHDWGNRTAKTTIFFLHGGPGSGCRDKHKLAFDPTKQHVIFHDQRGSGKSTPKGRWHHNTTQDLANDISTIADKLGVKKFIITGNSWGSTLSLYYALQNPTRVTAIVISGVFTATQWENDWINKGLYAAHFPDVWENYRQTVPKEFQNDPTSYHMERAFGKNPDEAADSARIFGDMESATVSLNDYHVLTTEVDYDPSSSLIEMRYLSKNCFIPERYILENAHTLTMPLYIVQGRYDFVCPPATAYSLSKLVPNAHLTWVQAGHAAEHETTSALKLIYHFLTK